MAASIACSSITGSFYVMDDSSEENEGGCTASSFASRKLFGRTNESSQLLDTFHEVIRDHTTRIVAIHGNSGMGKTSLAVSLREKVVDSHGYFCAGKFFQNSTNEAYSAIMAAFSDLCDLVIQAKDFDQRRNKIRTTLGRDGYILADLLSSISPFLPPDEDGFATSTHTIMMDKAALTRFRVACKHFLRAMSHERHPIVIFIDDIQWADEGSRLLISTLLADDELRHVLFVLAYRDEEAERTENLLEKSGNEDIIDIQVGNLNLPAIEELLSYSMGEFPPSGQELCELSKIVESKTQGNPFHVSQFLTFIHEAGLLTFSGETNNWEFDTGDIQQQTMVPESLVEILQLRMDRLAPNVLKTLMVAAFLGYSFEERVLVDVTRTLEDQQRRYESTQGRPKQDVDALMVKKALNTAVHEGIIERSTAPGHYLFSHDKLLSSFCARNQAEHGDETAEIDFAIAQSFLNLKGVNDEDYPYRAAQHANEARSLFENCYGPFALAELNLEAARYCIKRSYFYRAADHLREGIELLTRKGISWEQNYDLRLTIHENLAEVEMVLGNFSACKILSNKILLHGKSQESKTQALWNQVSVRVAENQMSDSIRAGKEALTELGVTFPVKVNTFHIVRKLFRVKSLLRTMSDDDVLNLPVLTDTSKIAAHRFLVHIAVMSMMDDQEKPGMYAALTLMESTLREGLSKFSSTGLAVYAISEASMGSFENAYRYGRLAATLASKSTCIGSQSATMSLLAVCATHWKIPVRDLVEPFSRAFSMCFSIGNLWYGTMSSSNNLMASLLSDGNLVEIEGRARYFLARFKEYNQEQLAFWILPILQCVLNLMTPFDNWRDATTLTGEVIVEDEFLQTWERTHALKGATLTLKLMLAYHFRCYDVAEQALKEFESSAAEKVMRVHYSYYSHHFFAGMTCIALFRETQKKMYLRKARSHKKHLLKLRSIKCPNSEPLLLVLLAEELSLTSGDLSRYEAAVETAAEACTKARLMQHTGLVYERAGFIHAERKNTEKAEKCFDRAMSLYRDEWGSQGKSDWLCQERQQVLNRVRRPTKMWGLQIEVRQTSSEGEHFY